MLKINKDKIKIFWELLKKEFITPFGLMTFGFTTILYIFSLINEGFMCPEWVFFTGIFCGFLSLTNFYLNLNKNILIKKVIYGTFLILFLTNIIYYFISLNYNQPFNSLMTVLSIYSGIFLFCFNSQKKEEINQRKGLFLNILLIFILIIGFLLRFIHVGKLSLWADEGTVFIASQNILNTGKPFLETGFLYLRDLFHLYINSIFINIFGTNEFSIRFISVIAGTLFIFISYLILKKITDLNGVILGTILISTSPWLIEYSRHGRSYILVNLFVIITFYFLLKILEKPKIKNIYLFTLFGILAIFTHQTGQVVLLFIIPVVIMYFRNIKKIINLIISFFLIFFSLFISKVISSKGYYLNIDQVSEDKRIAVTLVDKIMSYIPLSNFNIDYIFFIKNPIPLLSFIALIFLFVLLVRYRKNTQSQNILLLTSLSFITIIAFSKEPVNINRGILFLFPFIVFLVSISYPILLNLIPNKRILSVVNTLILITVFFWGTFISYKITFARYGDSINPYHSPFEGFIYRQDNRSTYLFLNEKYMPGDIVLVYGTPQFYSMYANFKPNFRIWSGSTATVGNKNIYTNIPEINTPEEIDKIIEDNKRIWFITSYSIFSGTSKAPRVFHINQNLIKHLNDLEKKVMYESEDPGSKVFLIEKN